MALPNLHGRTHLPGGSDPIPGGAEQTAFVYGRMPSGSTPTFVGHGCTAIRTGTGRYSVTFSPPLSAIPAITVSAYGNGSEDVNLSSAAQVGSMPTALGFTVTTTNPSTTDQDCGFDFIAVTLGVTGGARFPVQAPIEYDSDYDAFPWCCYLEDGETLVAVYREGASHTSTDGKVVLEKSTDGGLTWTGKMYVKSPAGGHDYRDPSICLTSTGRLIINFFDYDGANVLGIYTTYSDDDGATWSSLPAINALYTKTTQRGATSAGILACDDGTTLVMTVYGQDTGHTSDQFGVIRSTNDGASWGSLIRVTGTNSNRNEATLIDFGGGHIRAYIRGETLPGPIYYADSNDYGATWGGLTSLGFNVVPGRPAVTRSLITGTLFLAYRSTDTSYAAYRYSIDQGLSWSDEVIYSYAPYQYAGGIGRPGTDEIANAIALELPGGECVLLFYTWVVSS